MSVTELVRPFNSLDLKDKKEIDMHSKLQTVLAAVIATALHTHRQDFDKKLEEITKKFTTTLIANVESFAEVQIVGHVKCEM